MLNSFELTRRRMLGIIASSLPLSRMRLEIPLPRDIWTRRLEEFLGRHGEQAECGWLNREDLIYHDLSRPAASLNTDPEFCAFLDRVWIFNKAMEWHQRNGCILCCSVGGDLQLTGENQVSRWHSDPANRISQAGEDTAFRKQTTLRPLDCAVLPAFQFHLGQHPLLQLEVKQASCEWQLLVSIKGRSGPPFFISGWRHGSGTVEANLAGRMRELGCALNFAELHFVLALWTGGRTVPGEATFRLRLASEPAVVACLPVIRTAETASGEGVPMAALALDERGRRLGADRVRLYARVGDRRIPLSCQDEFWTATLSGLTQGNHDIPIEAEGSLAARGRVQIRVTDGNFYSYDRARHQIARNDRPIGPLSGSFQGTFFFADVGHSSEKMVQGQAAWDAWDRRQPPGEHMHYWEALTEQELDQRFAYLKECGWDLLHLCQHWGIWERLDAGGRIAPHGAEQLALYLRVADRHGLASIQALSHYPYRVRTAWNDKYGTPPFSRYVDAGFQNEDWFNPSSPFTQLFHEYLRDFVTLFKDETALFGMTASGEGDFGNGLNKSLDTFRFVRSLDRRHLFLAEPVFSLTKLPADLCRGWEQDLLSSRTYFIGERIFPEFDFGVEFKFMQMGSLYLAEGNWPAPPQYVKFHFQVLGDDEGVPESWAGTLRYRTRLRDTLYLGLVHGTPILLTWDEQIAEDEHAIFRQIRSQVDWGQAFQEPPVAIVVDGTNAHGEGRRNLARYEESLSHLPIGYRLVLAEAPDQAPNEAVILDARRPFAEPRFAAAGGPLPDHLRQAMPLRISKGYCASYRWSRDRRTLMAYLYNVTNHLETNQSLAGAWHRIPNPADFKVELANLPNERLKYILYDLNTRSAYKQGIAEAGLALEAGETDHDFFLLVIPEGA